jgi:hypothetical protein
MAEDLVNELNCHSKEMGYVQKVKSALSELFGKTSAFTIMYHVGGDEVLQEPEIFVERLNTLLGKPGTELILRHILSKIQAE